MLSVRLVRMIEDHAEELTQGALEDIRSNPRTPSYHRLSREEMHLRLYDVYSNLGRWLGERAEEVIEATYRALGRRRRAEGIPLSEVLYALILTKHHLAEYILSAGVVGSAVELYQEEELNIMIGHFFDKALYFTARGYEEAASTSETGLPVAGSRQSA
jgi:hypothetical protein